MGWFGKKKEEPTSNAVPFGSSTEYDSDLTGKDVFHRRDFSKGIGTVASTFTEHGHQKAVVTWNYQGTISQSVVDVNDLGEPL